MASMLDNDCVMGGSMVMRTFFDLETRNPDMDFFVPNSDRKVWGMYNALRKSGVVWDNALDGWLDVNDKHRPQDDIRGRRLTSLIELFDWKPASAVAKRAKAEAISYIKDHNMINVPKKTDESTTETLDINVALLPSAHWRVYRDLSGDTVVEALTETSNDDDASSRDYPEGVAFRTCNGVLKRDVGVLPIRVQLIATNDINGKPESPIKHIISFACTHTRAVWSPVYAFHTYGALSSLGESVYAVCNKRLEDAYIRARDWEDIDDPCDDVPSPTTGVDIMSWIKPGDKRIVTKYRNRIRMVGWNESVYKHFTVQCIHWRSGNDNMCYARDTSLYMWANTVPREVMSDPKGIHAEYRDQLIRYALDIVSTSWDEMESAVIPTSVHCPTLGTGEPIFLRYLNQIHGDDTHTIKSAKNVDESWDKLSLQLKSIINYGD